MNRFTLGNNWRDAKRRMASIWSANLSTDASGMNPEAGDESIHVTAEKLQVKNLFAPASTIERVAARLLAGKPPAKSKAETKQQGEALSTWEDEGGPAMSPTQPSTDSSTHASTHATRQRNR